MLFFKFLCLFYLMVLSKCYTISKSIATYEPLADVVDSINDFEFTSVRSGSGSGHRARIKSAFTRDADHSAADHSASDHSAADHSAADNSAADNSAADNSAADNSAADNREADNRAADNSAADSSAVDNSAADNNAAAAEATTSQNHALTNLTTTVGNSTKISTRKIEEKGLWQRIRNKLRGKPKQNGRSKKEKKIKRANRKHSSTTLADRSRRCVVSPSRNIEIDDSHEPSNVTERTPEMPYFVQYPLLKAFNTPSILIKALTQKTNEKIHGQRASVYDEPDINIASLEVLLNKVRSNTLNSMMWDRDSCITEIILSSAAESSYMNEERSTPAAPKTYSNLMVETTAANKHNVKYRDIKAKLSTFANEVDGAIRCVIHKGKCQIIKSKEAAKKVTQDLINVTAKEVHAVADGLQNIGNKVTPKKCPLTAAHHKTTDTTETTTLLLNNNKPDAGLNDKTTKTEPLKTLHSEDLIPEIPDSTRQYPSLREMTNEFISAPKYSGEQTTQGSTTPDDLTMLRLLEELLEKNKDSQTSTISGKSSKQEFVLKKPETVDYNSKDIEELRGNAYGSDYEEESGTSLVENRDTQEQNYADTPLESSPTTKGLLGLSSKMHYNEFINGYKFYLNFAQGLARDNFSAQVRYQAHKHHNVDDIGKYILDKLPQLENVTLRNKRFYFNNSDLNNQVVGLKAEDSWFKKHFNLFGGSASRKKFHTTQTVTLKSPDGGVSEGTVLPPRQGPLARSTRAHSSRSRGTRGSGPALDETVFISTTTPSQREDKDLLELIRNLDTALATFPQYTESSTITRETTTVTPLLDYTNLMSSNNQLEEISTERKRFAIKSPQKMFNGIFKKSQFVKDKLNGRKQFARQQNSGSKDENNLSGVQGTNEVYSEKQINRVKRKDFSNDEKLNSDAKTSSVLQDEVTIPITFEGDQAGLKADDQTANAGAGYVSVNLESKPLNKKKKNKLTIFERLFNKPKPNHKKVPKPKRESKDNGPLKKLLDMFRFSKKANEDDDYYNLQDHIPFRKYVVQPQYMNPAPKMSEVEVKSINELLRLYEKITTAPESYTDTEDLESNYNQYDKYFTYPNKNPYKKLSELRPKGTINLLTSSPTNLEMHQLIEEPITHPMYYYDTPGGLLKPEYETAATEMNLEGQKLFRGDPMKLIKNWAFTTQLDLSERDQDQEPVIDKPITVHTYYTAKPTRANDDFEYYIPPGPTRRGTNNYLYDLLRKDVTLKVPPYRLDQNPTMYNIPESEIQYYSKNKEKDAKVTFHKMIPHYKFMNLEKSILNPIMYKLEKQKLKVNDLKPEQNIEYFTRNLKPKLQLVLHFNDSEQTPIVYNGEKQRFEIVDSKPKLDKQYDTLYSHTAIDNALPNNRDNPEPTSQNNVIHNWELIGIENILTEIKKHLEVLLDHKPDYHLHTITDTEMKHLNDHQNNPQVTYHKNAQEQNAKVVNKPTAEMERNIVYTSGKPRTSVNGPDRQGHWSDQPKKLHSGKPTINCHSMQQNTQCDTPNSSLNHNNNMQASFVKGLKQKHFNVHVYNDSSGQMVIKNEITATGEVIRWSQAPTPTMKEVAPTPRATPNPIVHSDTYQQRRESTTEAAEPNVNPLQTFYDDSDAMTHVSQMENKDYMNLITDSPTSFDMADMPRVPFAISNRSPFYRDAYPGYINNLNVQNTLSPRKQSRSGKDYFAAVKTKVNPLPAQYFTTPVPMQANEFAQFLKDNDIDIASMITPFTELSKFESNWIKTKKQNMFMNIYNFSKESTSTTPAILVTSSTPALLVTFTTPALEVTFTSPTKPTLEATSTTRRSSGVTPPTSTFPTQKTLIVSHEGPQVNQETSLDYFDDFDNVYDTIDDDASIANEDINNVNNIDTYKRRRYSSIKKKKARGDVSKARGDVSKAEPRSDFGITIIDIADAHDFIQPSNIRKVVTRDKQQDMLDLQPEPLFYEDYQSIKNLKQKPGMKDVLVDENGKAPLIKYLFSTTPVKPGAEVQDSNELDTGMTYNDIEADIKLGEKSKLKNELRKQPNTCHEDSVNSDKNYNKPGKIVDLNKVKVHAAEPKVDLKAQQVAGDDYQKDDNSTLSQAMESSNTVYLGTKAKNEDNIEEINEMAKVIPEMHLKKKPKKIIISSNTAKYEILYDDSKNSEIFEEVKLTSDSYPKKTTAKRKNSHPKSRFNDNSRSPAAGRNRTLPLRQYDEVKSHEFKEEPLDVVALKQTEKESRQGRKAATLSQSRGPTATKRGQFMSRILQRLKGGADREDALSRVVWKSSALEPVPVYITGTEADGRTDKVPRSYYGTRRQRYATEDEMTGSKSLQSAAALFSPSFAAKFTSTPSKTNITPIKYLQTGSDFNMSTTDALHKSKDKKMRYNDFESPNNSKCGLGTEGNKARKVLEKLGIKFNDEIESPLEYTTKLLNNSYDSLKELTEVSDNDNFLFSTVTNIMNGKQSKATATHSPKIGTVINLNCHCNSVNIFTANDKNKIMTENVENAENRLRKLKIDVLGEGPLKNSSDQQSQGDHNGSLYEIHKTVSPTRVGSDDHNFTTKCFAPPWSVKIQLNDDKIHIRKFNTNYNTPSITPATTTTAMAYSKLLSNLNLDGSSTQRVLLKPTVTLKVDSPKHTDTPLMVLNKDLAKFENFKHGKSALDVRNPFLKHSSHAEKIMPVINSDAVATSTKTTKLNKETSTKTRTFNQETSSKTGSQSYTSSKTGSQSYRRPLVSSKTGSQSYRRPLVSSLFPYTLYHMIDFWTSAKSTTTATPKKTGNSLRKRHAHSGYTAKDVASLEILIDFIDISDKLHPNSSEDPISTATMSKTTERCRSESTNSIQVHIAIPIEMTNMKRSVFIPDASKIRKVFAARMLTPVDIEYEVRSFTLNDVQTQATPTSKVTPELTAGLYLLVPTNEANKLILPYLKPISSMQFVTQATSNSLVNKATTTAQETVRKVPLAKEFIKSLNEDILNLYNKVNIFKNEANSQSRKKRNSNLLVVERKRQINNDRQGKLKTINWDWFKNKFAEHPSYTCTCKFKANQPMCKVCAASEAVMSELIFEFNNLASYMTDHCTEIQTFFWKNPTGGRNLRNVVRKIDRNLNDYFKRTKGKCKGRPCSSFEICKRDITIPKHVEGLKRENVIDDFQELAFALKQAKKYELCCDSQNLKRAADNLVKVTRDCVFQRRVKKDITNKMAKNYALDKINVNIYCKSAIPKTTSSIDWLKHDSKPKGTSKCPMYDFTNFDEDEIPNDPKKSFIHGLLKNVDPKKNFGKRESDRVELPELADVDSIWRNNNNDTTSQNQNDLLLTMNSYSASDPTLFTISSNMNESSASPNNPSLQTSTVTTNSIIYGKDYFKKILAQLKVFQTPKKESTLLGTADKKYYIEPSHSLSLSWWKTRKTTEKQHKKNTSPHKMINKEHTKQAEMKNKTGKVKNGTSSDLTHKTHVAKDKHPFGYKTKGPISEPAKIKKSSKRHNKRTDVEAKVDQNNKIAEKSFYVSMKSLMNLLKSKTLDKFEAEKDGDLIEFELTTSASNPISPITESRHVIKDRDNSLLVTMLRYEKERMESQQNRSFDQELDTAAIDNLLLSTTLEPCVEKTPTEVAGRKAVPNMFSAVATVDRISNFLNNLKSAKKQKNKRANLHEGSRHNTEGPKTLLTIEVSPGYQYDSSPLQEYSAITQAQKRSKKNADEVDTTTSLVQKSSIGGTLASVVPLHHIIVKTARSTSFSNLLNNVHDSSFSFQDNNPSVKAARELNIKKVFEKLVKHIPGLAEQSQSKEVTQQHSTNVYSRYEEYLNYPLNSTIADNNNQNEPSDESEFKNLLKNVNKPDDVTYNVSELRNLLRDIYNNTNDLYNVTNPNNANDSYNMIVMENLNFANIANKPNSATKPSDANENITMNKLEIHDVGDDGVVIKATTDKDTDYFYFGNGKAGSKPDESTLADNAFRDGLKLVKPNSDTNNASLQSISNKYFNNGTMILLKDKKKLYNIHDAFLELSSALRNATLNIANASKADNLTDNYKLVESFTFGYGRTLSKENKNITMEHKMNIDANTVIPLQDPVKTIAITKGDHLKKTRRALFYKPTLTTRPYKTHKKFAIQKSLYDDLRTPTWRHVLKHNSKKDNQASQVITRRRVCDVTATANHVLRMRRQMTPRDFERYVRNVPCYRYKNLPGQFFVQYKGLVGSWHKSNRYVKNFDAPSKTVLKWDWIRRKRALLSVDDYAISVRNEPNARVYGISDHDRNGYGKSDHGRNGYGKSDHDRNGYGKSDHDRHGYEKRDHSRNGYEKSDHGRIFYRKSDHGRNFYVPNDHDSNVRGRNGRNRNVYGRTAHHSNGFDLDTQDILDDTTSANAHWSKIIKNFKLNPNRYVTETAETKRGDGFETLYKDQDNVYRTLKERQKRTTGEEMLRLTDLPPLKPKQNEIYAILGGNIKIECAPSSGVQKALPNNYTPPNGVQETLLNNYTPPNGVQGTLPNNCTTLWAAERADMLKADNLVVNGTKISLNKVETRNTGSYTCIQGDKVVSVIFLTVIEIPEFHVVFLPMYVCDNGCSDDDLQAMTGLGPVMSEACFCGHDTVRILNPVCLKDADTSAEWLHAVGVLRACAAARRERVRCSAQCERDLHCALAHLSADNARELAAVGVVLSKHGVKALVPSAAELGDKIVVTHTLHTKDDEEEKYIQEMAANMTLGDVRLLMSCPAGFYLLADQKICAACPANTYSPGGAKAAAAKGAESKGGGGGGRSAGACLPCAAGTGSAPGAARCLQRRADRGGRCADWLSWPRSWLWPAVCVAALLSGLIVWGLRAPGAGAGAPSPGVERPTPRQETCAHSQPRSNKHYYSAVVPRKYCTPSATGEGMGVGVGKARRLSPSAVILARFFQLSNSSSKADLQRLPDSRESRFEQWRGRNIPPPLPPVDFDNASLRSQT